MLRVDQKPAGRGEVSASFHLEAVDAVVVEHLEIGVVAIQEDASMVWCVGRRRLSGAYDQFAAQRLALGLLGGECAA
jgi:hypothetical protein